MPLSSRVVQIAGNPLLGGIEFGTVAALRDHRVETTDLESHRLRRETFAVLVGDLAGYSRLIERDDVDTVIRLRHLRRQVVEPATRARGGRFVRFVGDSVFVAFGEVVAAVDCAIAIQRGTRLLNRGTTARCASAIGLE